MFPNAPRGLVYPGDEGVPRGTYPTDKNNVAPRLAAVWDVRGDGRTAVRSAWGLFYDTLPGQGDFFQNGTLAPPFQPLTEVNFPLQVSAPPFANPLQDVTGTPGFPAGLIFIGWGRDFATPVVQQYNLTVQQQVGANWGLEAGYVGSRGKNLPIFMEVNPTHPDSVAGAGDRAAPVPGVQPGPADLLRGGVVVRLAADERADAAVARAERARVVHAGAMRSITSPA